jgi:hypothetical protein
MIDSGCHPRQPDPVQAGEPSGRVLEWIAAVTFAQAYIDTNDRRWVRVNREAKGPEATG